MDAGQHDLPGIVAAERISASTSPIGRLRLGAARQRSDTEGTVVITAILRFDEGTGAQRAPGIGGRSRRAVKRLAVHRLGSKSGRDLQQAGHQAVFFKVGDDLADACQRGGLGRIERGPTAGDGDLADTQALELADFLARVGDRSRGDRAGIDNRQVSLLGAGDQGVPGETELAGILLNFGLVQTAADGIQINLHGW